MKESIVCVCVWLFSYPSNKNVLVHQICGFPSSPALLEVGPHGIGGYVCLLKPGDLFYMYGQVYLNSLRLLHLSQALLFQKLILFPSQ